MSNQYYLRIFISIIIFMSTLSIPLNISFTLVEALQQQQQQVQSDTIFSTKNVTDLTKTNEKNSNVKLENKTVNYYINSSGYLVYPTTSSISSIENNISSTIKNNTLPAVVIIH